jgi:hypothetical protein
MSSTRVIKGSSVKVLADNPIIGPIPTSQLVSIPTGIPAAIPTFFAFNQPTAHDVATATTVSNLGFSSIVLTPISSLANWSSGKVQITAPTSTAGTNSIIWNSPLTQGLFGCKISGVVEWVQCTKNAAASAAGTIYDYPATETSLTIAQTVSGVPTNLLILQQASVIKCHSATAANSGDVNCMPFNVIVPYNANLQAITFAVNFYNDSAQTCTIISMNITGTIDQ